MEGGERYGERLRLATLGCSIFKNSGVDTLDEAREESGELESISEGREDNVEVSLEAAAAGAVRSMSMSLSSVISEDMEGAEGVEGRGQVDGRHLSC